ncbi:MAG: hypothetical protein WDM88_04450 [Galbitalea sp.]
MNSSASITYFIDLPVYHWNWWTYFISDIALLVGLVLLGRALRGIAQWFLYAGALGWLLVVIWILVPFGALSTIGQWLGWLGRTRGRDRDPRAGSPPAASGRRAPGRDRVAGAAVPAPGPPTWSPSWALC